MIESGEQLKDSLNALDPVDGSKILCRSGSLWGERIHGDQALRAWGLGGSDPMVLVDLGWYRDNIGAEQTRDSLTLWKRWAVRVHSRTSIITVGFLDFTEPSKPGARPRGFATGISIKRNEEPTSDAPIARPLLIQTAPVSPSAL